MLLFIMCPLILAYTMHLMGPQRHSGSSRSSDKMSTLFFPNSHQGWSELAVSHMVSRPRNWITVCSGHFAFHPSVRDHQAAIVGTYTEAIITDKTSSACCKEHELWLFSRQVSSWHQWVTQDWIYELRIGSSLSVGLHFTFLLYHLQTENKSC